MDLEAVIDRRGFRGLPLRVALLGLLALVLDGFDIQAVAFAGPALVGAWHIPRADLTGVLAAGLVGLIIGAVALGRAGDLWGRRPALITSTLLFAVASAMCARADSLLELGVWRFITGLGLGAPLPLVASMIAEFTPRRWRSLGVALGTIGVPLGGLAGAALAQDIVPRYGWQSIFVAGAVLPAALAVVLLLWLPESPKFLARQAPGGERLRRLLAQLAPEVDWSRTRIEFAEAAAGARVRLWTLLQRPYRADTLALWLGFLSNLIVVYVFFNWLPTLLGGVGLPVAAAIRGSLAFNLGGMVGSLLSATLIARFGSRYVSRVIAAGSILSTFAIGQQAVFAGGGNVGWSLYAAVALSGMCVNGMQILFYIVATHAYPTALRSAGVGSCGAVGRVGGLLSTAIGGAMIAAGLRGTTFFAVLAATLLFALVAAFALRTHVPAGAQQW